MDSTVTVDIEEAKAIPDETEEDSSMEASASSYPLAHLKVRETIPMLSVRDSIRVAKDLLDPEPHPLNEALQNALRKRLMEIEAEKRARGRE